MKKIFSLLVFASLTLGAQSALNIKYSEQPAGLVQTPKDMAAWEGLACASGPTVFSPLVITQQAASKIAVADSALSAAQQAAAPKTSFWYRALTASEDTLNVSAMVVPSLQAAKVIKGSPWISGGIAASALLAKAITTKQSALGAPLVLPGTWVSASSPNISLAAGACTALLFFGEFSSSMNRFEVNVQIPPVTR